jgi:mannose-1-phosphate guanylyltransferase
MNLGIFSQKTTVEGIMKEQNNKALFGYSTGTNGSTVSGIENRLAIVLAGGTGLPSRGIIPAGFRGLRPPHFCRTAGGDFVINQTRKQIENFFTPRETMFVVTDEHLRYYQEVLKDVPPENLIVQPQDDGTTFAILYSALRLAMTNPSALIAFFPVDFYTPNPREFMMRVESACAFARRDPNLILLGIKPDSAETEREWIEPDWSAPVSKTYGVWQARHFYTNPPPELARVLMNHGALLNSSVMVGTVATFLRIIRRAAPKIYEKFSLVEEKFDTPSEQKAVQAAYYSQYDYTDFSRDVLEKIAEKLMVVPVPASLRSTVGIEPQAVSTMSKTIVNAPQKSYAARVRRVNAAN